MARLQGGSEMVTGLRYMVWLVAAIAAAQPVAVTGVAGARFRVADLAKAREFYTKVFGFTEERGASDAAVFRINGRQRLEFAAGAAKDPLEILYFAADGNPAAAMRDPDGHRLEFARAGAQQAGTGLSAHLLHVGMGVADLGRATGFYGGRFGGQEIFRRPDNQIVILRMPGGREDWVEFIVRQEQGSQDHICLEVPDIQKAFAALEERGAIVRGKPRVASNGYWVINMMDSNGLRVELMEPHPAAK